VFIQPSFSRSYHSYTDQIINSVTEILDVAPVDIFNAISNHFIQNFPAQMLTDKMRETAIDTEIFWVNETGAPAKLTAGATVTPTVS
jgi:hypothetical protein